MSSPQTERPSILPAKPEDFVFTEQTIHMFSGITKATRIKGEADFESMRSTSVEGKVMRRKTYQNNRLRGS
jgi:hypothetical protein